MLYRAEILDYLRENKKVFLTVYGVRKIGLFGSYARDEQSDQSDIDILISKWVQILRIFLIKGSG